MKDFYKTAPAIARVAVSNSYKKKLAVSALRVF